MGLLVVDPGFWTTVQDAGRVGYREWGVPVGGAFDRGSLELANALVGNDPGAAVLEMTLRGGCLEARGRAAMALAGAPMEARVVDPAGKERAVAIFSSTTLNPGERLVLGRTLEGARTYLAVRGGLRTPLRLESQSSEQPLQRGTLLTTAESHIPSRHLAGPIWTPPAARPFRILPGPDYTSLFDPEVLASSTFRVGARSNRLGLHLESPPVAARPQPDRLSAPISAGAVQLSGGQLILLGVASGTMGGYPHVAQVISADLDRVGQLRPGETLRFHLVSLEEARSLDLVDRRARRARLLRIASLARDQEG